MKRILLLGLGAVALLALIPVEQSQDEVMPVAPKAPKLLEGNSITLKQGVMYMGAFDVHAPASFFVSESMVKKEAPGQGFSNTKVSTTRPKDWPSQVKADYYASARYEGPTKSFDRSQVAGQVVAREVWEL